MGTQAFTPMGNTVTFTAATTSPAPVQAVSSTLGANQYRVHNSGAVVIALGFGTTSAEATASANTSVNGKTITMVPGSIEVFSLPGNAFFTGQTATSTAVVYISPGDGV